MAVRREKVILELDDQLTTGMARAAASSALLDKALDRTSGSVRRFGNDTNVAGKEIDRLSGRVRIFADVAAILGPTISPLGASLVTPLVGLTNQFGFAAIAGGTALLAFQGVGDALKAMNEYGLDPSEANAEKLNEAMSKLDSSGQDLVKTLHDLGPEIRMLRDTGADNMFPGVIDGLDTLETRIPEVQAIIAAASDTLGDLISEGAENLASDEWDEWFATVQHEAAPALEDMGHSLGNVVAGLAAMWQAFMPLSRDFSSGLLDMSRDFHSGADGLDDSEGFENFLQYVRESGPQAAEALGAIGNMLVQILQAAAPLGGPILKGIEAFADAISLIADSDLGTPIFAGLAALAAWNRAVGLATVTGKAFAGSRLAMGAAQRSGLTTMQADAKSFMAFGAMTRGEVAAQQAAGKRLGATMLKTGGAAAGLALAMSPLPEKVGLSNAAMGTMMGMLAGPWGAAVGGGVGLLMDMTDANQKAADAERRTTDAIKSGSAERIAARKKELEAERRAQKDSALAGFRKMFAFMGPDEGFSKSDKTQADLDKINKAQAATRLQAQLTGSALRSVYGKRVADTASQSVEDFQNAIESLNAVLSGRASMRDYEAALDGVAASIKENGRSLDITTEKGRNNQEALDRIASTALRVAENMSEIDRGRYMQRARRDFIAAAQDLGIGRKRARELADQLLGLDKINAKPKITLEAQAALALARQVQTAVANIRDRNIKIHTTYTQSGGAGRPVGGQYADAHGGIHFNNVRAFALGDVANHHQPELAGPGPTRVWREPETKGEAYIPLANDYRRPRARAIAAETVRLLGGEAHFATGGFTRSEFRSASRGFDLNANLSLAETRQELRTFAATVRKAGGSVGKGFGTLAKRAEATSRSLNAAKTSLDALRDKQAEAQSNAANSFNNNAFGGTFADSLLQLTADRNDSSAQAANIAMLRKRGISGDLAAALAGSGNLGLTNELRSATTAQLQQYQAMFASRAVGQAALGNQAAAAYTAQINAQSALIKRQTAVLNRLEARVEAGARRGISDNKKASKAKGKRR